MSDWLTELLVGPVEEAAPRLLGMRLVSELEGRTCAVVLSEVEAYGGSDDPASHAYRGQTNRNMSMFESAGLAYVYRSYGIHWCLNVVTGPAGTGQAILLRAGVPSEGLAHMVERRGRSERVADGPGKLCQALGVTGAVDGVDLRVGSLRVDPGTPPKSYESTGRVGISRAVDRKWRFVATD
ncbi:MAG: DNA-3-methyladenine glycosylase [Acidimicrobiia bacterium]|nr:DNA-3-methyladenine glycosylase [Acidimicrobiia bacterium]